MLAVTGNRRTLRRNSFSEIAANFVPSSPIFFNLMMEAIRSSETSVLTTVQKAAFFIVTAVKTSNLTITIT
jgi:hypothetical protein